jgi:hypothetical protein
MRKIELVDAVRIRFPGREEEFDDGVEIGVLAMLMANDQPVINRQVPARQIEQIQALAERFRYRCSVEDAGDDRVVTLRHVSQRPALRLVR